MTRAARVLVAGAGPTGLALALQAHAHGARVRIVERRREAFRPSRALIMHPRTLEVLRPLGVVPALLSRADCAPGAHLHLGSRVVHVRLGKLALPDTAFPHLTLLRQMDVETVLAEALAARGVTVERETELLAAEDGATEVRVTLRTPTGLEQITCDFLAGCDGPMSLVRRTAGIGWQGGPYAEEVVLADLELGADLAPGVAHVVAGRHGLVFLFALGERATWRLLATRPAGQGRWPYGEPGPSLPVSELQAMLNAAGLRARITACTWSGRYRLQHRLAARFRQGRLFLAGDAAHAHSPATGQGMNTGIQDAINLGWKLAFAPAAAAANAVLDSYERERRPAARRVLALTHAAFWFEAGDSLLPALLRGVVAPLGAPLLPLALRQRRLVAEVVRVVSQLGLAYAPGVAAVDGLPRPGAGPRAGQRLPDASVFCGGRRTRLHALLARPGVHVLLQRDAIPVDQRAFAANVSVHRLMNWPGTGTVAVRPDGYIGFRSAATDVCQLQTWLSTIGAAGMAGRGSSP